MKRSNVRVYREIGKKEEKKGGLELELELEMTRLIYSKPGKKRVFICWESRECLPPTLPLPYLFSYSHVDWNLFSDDRLRQGLPPPQKTKKQMAHDTRLFCFVFFGRKGAFASDFWLA